MPKPEPRQHQRTTTCQQKAKTISTPTPANQTTTCSEPPGSQNVVPRRPKVEAKNQTKMLFEIACQNFFRDRCRPDPQNHIGSVACCGGFSPTVDPATEPFRLNGGRERKRCEDVQKHCDKHSFFEAQRLTLVRLPKSPLPLAPPVCRRTPPPWASKSLKNRLKISLVFWSAVGPLLGPKMEPQMLPNRSREPLKTHLASEAVFGHVFDRFLDDF